MEKYISKFITYLQQKTKNELHSLVAEDVIYYSYYKELIQYFSSDQQTIFLNFDILSTLLEESNLNSHEKTNLILYLLKKNINLGIITTNKKFILLEDIIKYNFTTIDKIDLIDLLNNPYFDAFMSLNEERIEEETLTIRNEIQEFINSHDYSKVFNEAYTLINDILTKSIDFDINKLTNALKSLKISDSIISNISYVLNKKHQENNEKVSIPRTIVEKEEKFDIKEYNLLLSELQEYFDFNNMQPKKVLTIEEQIYCVSLMTKLRFSPSKRKDFLRLSNKYLINNIKDPVILFNILFPILYYYKDNELVKECISNIEDCLKNMLDCDEVEYHEWESLINDELHIAIETLPKDYIYELTLSK